MSSIKSFLALAVTALLTARGACSEFHARTSTVDADFHLFVYTLAPSRGDIRGLPVIYGDGAAYAGFAAPSGVESASNVTFTSSSTSTLFTVSSDENAFSDNQLLFVDTTASGFGDVGFANTSNDAAQNTTDFGLYGAWVFRQSSAGAVTMNWFAEQTETDGVWQLKWNNVGTPTNGVPVALRTQAPAVAETDTTE